MCSFFFLRNRLHDLITLCHVIAIINCALKQNEKTQLLRKRSEDNEGPFLLLLDGDLEI